MALYTSGEEKQTKYKKIINDNYEKTFHQDSLKRRQSRKTIMKQQNKKVRFFIIFFTIFSIILGNVFFLNLNSLFINRLKNGNIRLPNNISFIKPAEYILAVNGDFLDTRMLEKANTENPLMKTPILKNRMFNLTSRLRSLAFEYPLINPGVFVWDYNTGDYVDINADNAFPTASIIKLPILFQLYMRAEKGLINMEDTISLEKYYITGGSGYLQYSPPGTALSYRRLAELMIQDSDNTATNMLLSAVGGMNGLNSEIKRWGLKVTGMSEWLPDLTGTNISTPREMGTMLYNIGNTDMLPIKTRAEMIDIMSHVRNRGLIQAGLPHGVGFVHKTGDIGTMLGDAGVVALPDGRKYIVVIMVERPWNSFQAKEFIVKASETIYDSYIKGNQ